MYALLPKSKFTIETWIGTLIETLPILYPPGPGSDPQFFWRSIHLTRSVGDEELENSRIVKVSKRYDSTMQFSFTIAPI